MVYAQGVHCCVVSRMKAWTQIDDVDEKDGGTADGLRWHLQEGSSRQTRIRQEVRTRGGVGQISLLFGLDLGQKRLSTFG